jgi:hypothetical protein
LYFGLFRHATASLQAITHVFHSIKIAIEPGMLSTMTYRYALLRPTRAPDAQDKNAAILAGRPVWDGYRGIWIRPRIQVCD